MKLLIMISLVFLSYADGKNQSENEVGRVFQEFLVWRMTQPKFPLELPEEYREALEKFSEEEIIRGLLDRFSESDADQGMLNDQHRDVTVIKFNPYLIEDVLPLHHIIAEKSQPREFFHLSGLASSLTQARGHDFIPSYFNTLFRDGRVAMEQGEYTTDFAGDVSILAYRRIILALEEFESDYLSTRPEGLSHEEEVDHLARWLIANWPGCENFTLSDQNVPAILASSFAKNISRDPRSQSEEIPALTKEAFKFSWPIIAAITLLIGSVAYWGKKKFAH